MTTKKNKYFISIAVEVTEELTQQEQENLKYEVGRILRFHENTVGFLDGEKEVKTFRVEITE